MFYIYDLLEELPSGGAAYTLSPTTGTYTLSGKTTTRAVGVPAAQGTYTLTGFTTTRAIGLPAAQGAYTLTGFTTTRAIGMPAAQGTYTLTGNAQTVGKSLSIAPAAGSYLLSGKTISAPVGRLLAPTTGIYTQTGFTIVSPSKVGGTGGRTYSRKRWWQLLQEQIDERYPRVQAPSKAKQAIKARRQVQKLVEDAVEDGLLSEANEADAVELAQLVAKTQAARQVADALRYAELVRQHIQQLEDDDEEDVIYLLGII